MAAGALRSSSSQSAAFNSRFMSRRSLHPEKIITRISVPLNVPHSRVHFSSEIFPSPARKSFPIPTPLSAAGAGAAAAEKGVLVGSGSGLIVWSYRIRHLACSSVHLLAHRRHPGSRVLAFLRSLKICFAKCCHQHASDDDDDGIIIMIQVKLLIHATNQRPPKQFKTSAIGCRTQHSKTWRRMESDVHWAASY